MQQRAEIGQQIPVHRVVCDVQDQLPELDLQQRRIGITRFVEIGRHRMEEAFQRLAVLDQYHRLELLIVCRERLCPAQERFADEFIRNKKEEYAKTLVPELFQDSTPFPDKDTTVFLYIIG